jgi:hypothetical protein
MEKIKIIKKLAYTQKEAEKNVVAVKVSTIKSLSKRDLKKIKEILKKSQIVRCSSYDDFVEGISQEELNFLESNMLSIRVKASKLFQEANGILLASYGGWTKTLDLSKPAYYVGYKPVFLKQVMGSYIGYTSIESDNSYVRFEKEEKISNCKKYKLV